MHLNDAAVPLIEGFMRSVLSENLLVRGLGEQSGVKGPGVVVKKNDGVLDFCDGILGAHGSSPSQGAWGVCDGETRRGSQTLKRIDVFLSHQNQ